MLRSTIRLWADELDALPEYSHSMPSGVCLHKCWKRKVEDGWIVGCYGFPDERGFLNMWFDVVLLQGPRRSGTPSRLKTACCVKHELRPRIAVPCTCVKSS
jgi:hypothetical protein